MKRFLLPCKNFIHCILVIFLAAFPATVTAQTSIWVGTTSNWFTATNWNPNGVPTSTTDVNFNSGTPPYPIIDTGTAVAKDVIINSGASITVNGGRLIVTSITIGNSGAVIGISNGGEVAVNNLTLNASAEITVDNGFLALVNTITPNGGTVNAENGTISIVGTTGSQNVPGSIFSPNIVRDLRINNSSGVTLTGSTMVNLSNSLTIVNGIFTTGGNITLLSNASGTAYVANSDGDISGNITVQQYIPGGRRAFRFFGHPFTGDMPLSQLTDDIDITGSGGAANGFTTTGTNNPSAFYYDQSLGDNSTVGTNPGWQAYTSANTSQWTQYQAARILVRGAKGEGLDGLPYTPGAVTLDMTGEVNQGPVVINLTKGSNTDFILVGNPYPSQVDMNLVVRSNIGSSFTVWDANQGMRGGYTSNPFSTSYIFPSFGSFVTTMTAASGSLTFDESYKSPDVPASLFKTTAMSNTVQLRIIDDSLFWDRLLLRFDVNTSDMKDYEDAIKLNNPDLDFTTIATDGTPLSIDTRPYKNGQVIPLALRTSLLQQYKITVPGMDIPAGTKMYLHDKYAGKTEELFVGYQYTFTVSSDTLSQGKRFELSMAGDPVDIGWQLPDRNKLQVNISPNPATNQVQVAYTAPVEEKLNIRIVNMTGHTVYNATTPAQYSGTISIPLGALPAGVYIAEVTGSAGIARQKIIKQ